MAEQLLVTAQLPKAGRWWHRRDTVILAYHNIVPDGETASGDRSLHLPRRRFAEQLHRLSETHEVIGLDELTGAEPSSVRPRAVITFDDAYRGALQYGLPELTRRGMSATVFVAPGLLGDKAFWWDLVASDDTGSVPDSLRSRLLGLPHRGMQDQVLSELTPEIRGSDRVPPHSRSATVAELRAAAAEHAVVFGSHTWSHPNLTALGDADVSSELQRSWRWLVGRFASVVPWLAYPYGLNSKRVTELAQAVYRGALELGGALAPSRLDGVARHQVPRINVPAGLTLNAFELRVSGVVRR